MSSTINKVSFDFDKVDDKIYFNAVIGSPSFAADEVNSGLPETQNGQILIQFNQPLLANPRDYYLTIQRMSVPTSGIPVFVAEPYDKSVDPDVLVFNIGLRYGINNYTQYVKWIPQVQYLSSSSPEYYWCNNIQYALAVINKAFAELFATIPATPGGSEPPVLMLDIGTRLIQLKAQTAFYQSAVDGTGAQIEVYVNQPLGSLLPSMAKIFYAEASPLADTRLLVYNLGNNTDGSYTIMSQSAPSLSLWSPLKTITASSNSLGIIPEFLPSSIPGLSNTNNAVLTNSNIIKDFVPFTSGADTPIDAIQFANNGPPQLINLLSKEPLQTLDMKFQWMDKYGRLYPIMVPYNQTISVKLGFLKKSTYMG